jgi:hypothetical protein
MMNTFCAVEHDLARYESRIAEEDRMEEARDRAVAVERERLDLLPLGEVLNERSSLRARLRDISDNPSWTEVRIDLEALVDALALQNVESEVERARRLV